MLNFSGARINLSGRILSIYAPNPDVINILNETTLLYQRGTFLWLEVLR